MLVTPDQARQLICPTIAAGTGKRTKCQADGCMWWRYAGSEGVPLAESGRVPSKPVGHCGLLPEPSMAAVMVQLGQGRPRTSTALRGEPFDTARLTAGAAPDCAEPTTHETF